MPMLGCSKIVVRFAPSLEKMIRLRSVWAVPVDASQTYTVATGHVKFAQQLFAKVKPLLMHPRRFSCPLPSSPVLSYLRLRDLTCRSFVYILVEFLLFALIDLVSFCIPNFSVSRRFRLFG